MKTRNYQKIIEMDWHGNNNIAFQFNSILKKNYWIELVFKKIVIKIDSINSIYDPQLPKVNLVWNKQR